MTCERCARDSKEPGRASLIAIGLLVNEADMAFHRTGQREINRRVTLMIARNRYCWRFPLSLGQG